MYAIPSQPQVITKPDGSYHGYISLSDKSEYFISLHVSPAAPRLKAATELQEHLDRYPGKVTALLAASSSPLNIIESVVQFLEDTMVMSSLDSSKLLVVIKQITSLPPESVKSVDKELEQITLQVTDEGERSHYITIQLDSAPPKCVCDLPEEVNITSSVQWSCQKILDNFREIIMKYQMLWDMLDDIDTKAWVIEPDPFTRGALHWRIVLTDGVSLIINIDPLQPYLLPRCRFLGAIKNIQPLQSLIDEGAERWDTNSSILENLEEILQLKVPNKPDSETSDLISIDCGICYCYDMCGEVPEMTCNNDSCNQLYHVSCLVEWFRGLVNVRQSFGTVFGECPYCSKAMHIQAVL